MDDGTAFTFSDKDEEDDEDEVENVKHDYINVKKTLAEKAAKAQATSEI